MAVKVLFAAEGFITAEAQGKAGLAITVNADGTKIDQLVHAENMEQLTRIGVGALYGVAAKMVHDGVPLRMVVKTMDDITDVVINEILDQRAKNPCEQTVFSSKLNL